MTKKISIYYENKKIEDIENEEWFPIYNVNLEELEVIKTTYFNRDGSIRKTMIYDKEKGWIDNEIK